MWDSFWRMLQRQSMICELLFPSSILAVKLNRKTLVIVLETEIYIYDISNMRLLHVIETTPNPEGEYENHSVSTFTKRHPFSYMCALSLCRQLLPRIPIPSTFAYLTPCCTRHIHPASASAAAVRRCPPLFNQIAHSRQCHPSAQGTHLLPLHQLYRYSARFRLR